MDLFLQDLGKSKEELSRSFLISVLNFYPGEENGLFLERRQFDTVDVYDLQSQARFLLVKSTCSCEALARTTTT